jgi:hypothetical protein
LANFSKHPEHIQQPSPCVPHPALRANLSRTARARARKKLGSPRPRHGGKGTVGGEGFSGQKALTPYNVAGLSQNRDAALRSTASSTAWQRKPVSKDGSGFVPEAMPSSKSFTT